jgi:hypothetical protein
MSLTFIPVVKLDTGVSVASMTVPVTAPPLGEDPIKFLATAIPTATPTPAPLLEKATEPAPTPTDASMVDSLLANTSTLPTGTDGEPIALFSIVEFTRVEIELTEDEEPPEKATADVPTETATLAA